MLRRCTTRFRHPPEERKQYAEIILKKADDLEGLINDLIDFIKVDTGEWRTTWQDVNLKSFVEEIAKRGSEATTILKHNFKAEIDLPTACPSKKNWTVISLPSWLWLSRSIPS